MNDKYYCEDYDEYSLSIKNIPYRIYDLTKSNKTKEDFYDNEKECYDIAAFEEYLLDNDCMLTSNQVKDRLIKQEEKIKQLEKELALMKDKAYYYGCCAIGETSSNYDKDIDEFRKEIYGEEKAEQIKQQEIKEHQESLQRLKEQRLVKVNCYKCKHGVWFGNDEGLTCEKRIKPFPNECEYFVRH